MKWRVLIGLVFGLVLMVASVELYAKGDVFSASVTGIFAAYMFLLAGIEIGVAKKYGYDKSEDENIRLSANLEDLKAGGPRNFVISQGPFLGDCSRTKDCSAKFFLLDFVNLADNSADMLLLKLDITDKIALEEALEKAPKEGIKQGVKFSVDENHNITKTKL